MELPPLGSFVRALGSRESYLPHRNPFVLLGFLWGLPIPFVTIGLHLGAAGLPVGVDSIAWCLARQPLHWIFLAHPVLFAIAFGAMGSVAAAWRRRSQELIDTDGLTGLLNHRAFQMRIRAEAARAEREGRPISLVMIDLDRFKEFNDAHGHPAGDRLLASVAAHLRRQVRPYDAVCRHGGEEFAVILPYLSEEEALRVAERMRAGTEETTLSAGVCERRPRELVADWIERTDTALYDAKRAGRNRVCVG
jgi:diguanylate cyclase (GGDEF)-like protein